MAPLLAFEKGLWGLENCKTLPDAPFVLHYKLSDRGIEHWQRWWVQSKPKLRCQTKLKQKTKDFQLCPPEFFYLYILTEKIPSASVQLSVLDRLLLMSFAATRPADASCISFFVSFCGFEGRRAWATSRFCYTSARQLTIFFVLFCFFYKFINSNQPPRASPVVLKAACPNKLLLNSCPVSVCVTSIALKIREIFLLANLHPAASGHLLFMLTGVTIGNVS